jgi:6-pyruvoyltetrahydropterin/6-carboxytetrahydropterin synthase
MQAIRVTKIFHFEMAHALYGYNGACKNLHGHSYELYVTLIGKPELNKDSPHVGMVIDFKILKAILNESIIEKLDHSMMLNNMDPGLNFPSDSALFKNKLIVPFQPTCENILLYMSQIIKKKLPPHTMLHSLKLKETPTSFAEWFESDQ